jgi:ribulose-bisphosphate carboxylase large chain
MLIALILMTTEITFSIFTPKINRETYVIGTYYLESKVSIRDAAWNLAIGQSVGNPNVRNRWETNELFENHSCVVEGDESKLAAIKSGTVNIGFPIVNTDWAQDGVTHLLVQLMGGQLDIDSITACHLLKLDIPSAIVSAHFLGPKFGISGVRRFTGTLDDMPLLGGIVKPKIGVSVATLVDMVKELVAGGVNFIKEDEIMANPACCPLAERVPAVMDVIRASGRNVVYAVCINADAPYVLDRAREVARLGGNAIHVNFWAGLGVYKALRDLDTGLFIHFQKSGDKILTDKSHRFHIDWKVVCYLAGISGVDFIHAGMWGGYSCDEESELRDIMSVLHAHGVIPALSCGMHPGLVAAIVKRFGPDFMANCGGAIHGHPGGTLDGVRAMRQAINGELDKPEYTAAIAKWGYIE